MTIFKNKNTQITRSTFWLSVVIVLYTLLVFFPVVHNGFIFYDDATSIWNNPHVYTGLSFENFKWAVTSTNDANWFPLTWIWHQFDCQIYGLMPGAHHVTSLYLHIVNALLLFFLLCKLTKHTGLSFWVALVFAIHPLRVEVVAWASEKKEILCLFFMLISLLSYTEYKTQAKNRWLGVSVLSFFLSIMAKPMSISLPLLLCLIDFWPLKNNKQQADSFTILVKGFYQSAIAIEKWPFWCISSFSGFMTVISQGSAGAINSLATVPINIRFWNACNSYFVYLYDFFWPKSLYFLYPLVKHDLTLKGIIAFSAIIMITLLAHSTVKTKPFFLFGWYWYLISLLPVIGLVSIGSIARADRYTYLPAIGITIALIWLLNSYFQKSPYFKNMILVPFCLFLGITSFYQVQTWKTDRSLLEHALHNNPNNSEALLVLATVELTESRPEQAILHLQKAEFIKKSSSLFFLLGKSYLLLNQYEKAKTSFQEAVRINSDVVDSYKSHIKLGEIFEAEKDYSQAEKEYLICISKQPFFKLAQLKLARLYCRKGDYDEARVLIKSSLKYQYNPLELRGTLHIESWERKLRLLSEQLRKKTKH